MNARSTLIAIGATAALALPSTANAADLYAQQGGGDRSCAQATPCDLAVAIDDAGRSAGPDRIHVVGRLSLTTPVDISGSPIELTGSGTGPEGTSITTPAGTPALRVGSSSSATNLSAHSAHQTVILAAGATMRDALVTASGNDKVAIAVGAGSATTLVERVSIGAPVGLGIEATDAILRLHEVDVTGSRGIDAIGPDGRLEVERSTIAANRGVVVRNGAATISNTVIREALVGVSFVNGATGFVRSSTIDGLGGGCGVCVDAEHRVLAVLVHGSIVQGFQHSLLSMSPDPSLYVKESNMAGGSPLGVTDGGGNLSVDPRWLDEDGGDYRLRLDSPLIDRVATSDSTWAGGLDRLGHARNVDGDGDGRATPDMGAFEFTPDPADTGNGQPVEPPDGPGGTPSAPATTLPTHVETAPASVTPPTPVTPPALRLGGRTLALDPARRVRLPVSCPSAATASCTVKLLVTTASGRPRRLGSGTATIRRGATARLSIRLSKRALALRAVKVTAKASGTSRASRVYSLRRG